jgi:hypothetical protein
VAAIAAEPQFAKAAAVLLRQNVKGVKVGLLEIDPLETADAEPLHEQGPDWYLGRMRANLKALADGLP